MGFWCSGSIKARKLLSHLISHCCDILQLGGNQKSLLPLESIIHSEPIPTPYPRGEQRLNNNLPSSRLLSVSIRELQPSAIFNPTKLRPSSSVTYYSWGPSVENQIPSTQWPMSLVMVFWVFTSYRKIFPSRLKAI